MDIPERIEATTNDLGVTAIFSFIADIMIQMEMVFDIHPDHDRLRKAMDLILDAEPVLGCRFVHHPKRPFWIRLPMDDRHNFQVFHNRQEFDLFKVSGIDIRKGPGLTGGLLREAGGDRLLLKIAHEMADAGGVKDIAFLLSSIYEKLKEDTRYRPEPNLMGERGPGQVLRRVPWFSFVKIFFNYLRELMAETIPYGSFNPEIGELDRSSRRYFELYYSPEEVMKLKQFAGSHRGTLNDLILSVFSGRLSGLDGMAVKV